MKRKTQLPIGKLALNKTTITILSKKESVFINGGGTIVKTRSRDVGCTGDQQTKADGNQAAGYDQVI